MDQSSLPFIIDASQLEAVADQAGLLIIDLSKAETWLKYHIPGAVHLEYNQIIGAHKPVMGLLPDNDVLSRALSSVGLTADSHVVAYDDEGGGKAGRLLWTLAVGGHSRYSLLNGGLIAWANEGHQLVSGQETATASDYQYKRTNKDICDRQTILEHLDDANVRLLDSRSVEEFSGAKKFSARGGHIPGAVNMDWLLTIDQNNNLRLKDDTSLLALLEERGISRDNEVIVYCQTHHRSSHTWCVLKHLGFENIKGYPGAWSDWGNQEDTPVET
ncbi:MAG TPA: sulfurtransferase [Gammaproteobacteria bacterium]|nr:sulfurtransferase [Gammaproteobacteria bacterium]